MGNEETKGDSRCFNCGKPARRVQRNYLFRESGLPNVTLKDIQVVTCDNCGDQDPIIPRLNEVFGALVSATVRKPRPLRGEDVRFLRKQMDKSGESFARILGVDKTTLSKWENNQIPIGPISDRLIRAVVLGLGPSSKEEIEKGLSCFNEIDDSAEPVQIEINVNDLAVKYE
jgi:DNA-binding transcriptional regulator YiaG